MGLFIKLITKIHSYTFQGVGHLLKGFLYVSNVVFVIGGDQVKGYFFFRILIKTLNLNMHWSKIEERLEEVVKCSFFYKILCQVDSHRRANL